MPEGTQPVEIPVTLNAQQAGAVMDRLRERFQTMSVGLSKGIGGMVSNVASEFAGAALAPATNQFHSYIQGSGTMLGGSMLPMWALKFGNQMAAYMGAREQTAQMFQFGGSNEQILSAYHQNKAIIERQLEGTTNAKRAIDVEEEGNLPNSEKALQAGLSIIALLQSIVGLLGGGGAAGVGGR